MRIHWFLLVLLFCGGEVVANIVVTPPNEPPLTSSTSQENREHATGAVNIEHGVSGIKPSGFSAEKAAFKAGGGLLLMLSLLFLVAYLAKRKGLMQGRGQRRLLLRETLNLGPKEKLAVIDFAGESMVVGITAHSIRLIRAVKNDESDGYESNPELGAKTAFDFQTKLNDFLLKGSR